MCQILEVDRSTYHYKSRRPGQASLESKIKEICQTRVRYGYRRVHVLLRREGWLINQKKTRRIYRELGLQLRNKTPKRRVKAKLRSDRRAPTRSNETSDFRKEQLALHRLPPLVDFGPIYFALQIVVVTTARLSARRLVYRRNHATIRHLGGGGSAHRPSIRRPPGGRNERHGQ